jgi:anti-anti-sigma regulatory factor
MKQRKKANQSRAGRARTAAHQVQESTATAQESAPVVFQIPSECTVADAESLKAALAKLLTDPGAVTLDIGALQRIDTAGLQVIGAFVREREALNRPFAWSGESPAFVSAAKLLGLGALLKLQDLQA